jgi:hypothetical protein
LNGKDPLPANFTGSHRKLGRRQYLKYTGTAAKVLGVVGVSACAASHFIPRASASYPGAKIEIYKAVEGNSPTIDGVYNMTQKQVAVTDPVTGQSKNVMIDEWNDATWIQVPNEVSVAGKITAYAGYKYVLTDAEKSIYFAVDVPSITTNPSLDSKGLYCESTSFDPLHVGGTQQAYPDDFVVGACYVNGNFETVVRYGQSSGKYQTVPTPATVVTASKMCPTPFSPTPHLFYEMRIPLTAGNIDQNLDRTMAMYEDVYNNRSDNFYPPANWILDNYADVTFSKGTNPSLTTPPTVVVPEFPYSGGAVLALSLGGGYVILRRNMKRRQSLQVMGAFLAGSLLSYSPLIWSQILGGFAGVRRYTSFVRRLLA